MSVDENILAESLEDTLVGTLFADAYEIISVLGKGGMSVVYKARYVPMDQLVAVKVMHAHMAATQATLQRLKQEAKLCSTLDHPNIVRVMRLHISDDGFPFMVAELLEGRTIQTAIRQDGPFDEERFHHVFSQVLDALEYAHARGIIHRDIKPSNLMLIENSGSDQKEIVKIVDFGISKMLCDSAAITQGITQSNSGNIFGSPPYMSPEQCTGGRSDNRSDLYAAACVMYEALTGQQAFCGDTALDTMFQQVHDRPPSFAQAAPGRVISPVLEAAVFAALRKDPAERPQSVCELRATLLGKRPTKRHTRIARLSRSGLRLVTVCTLAAAAGLALIKFGHIPALDGSADDSGRSARLDTAAGLPLSFSENALGCYRQGESVAHYPSRSTFENQTVALPYFQRANLLLSREPTNKTAATHVFEIKHRLGCALEAVGRHQEALPYLQEALAVGRAITPDLAAIACASITTTYTNLHQPQEALEYALLCVQYNNERYRKSSFQKFALRDCVESYLCLASCYQVAGQSDQAEAALRKALQLSEHQDTTPCRLEALRAMANHCLNLNRNSEAKDWLEQYFKLEASPGVDIEESELPGKSHELYAIALQRLGDLPAAQREYELACQQVSRTYPLNPVQMKAVLAPILVGKAVNSYLGNDIEGGDRDLAAGCKLYREIGNAQAVPAAETAGSLQRTRALKRIASSHSTGK